MVLKPGAFRTMSAALLAASVAPATATPTLAFFNAGASFTPSPEMPGLSQLALPTQCIPVTLPWKALFHIRTCHADSVASLLQSLDNLEFVLW
eukprot:scaffold4482_cov393-Prasinococcus_capsulatus_cf.AAC.6